MNINQAIAQANRRQRALNIIAEGYTFWNMGTDSGIAVCKPDTFAPAYWINGPFHSGCDCPDRAKGNYCKHEMAWDILQEEAAAKEALEAQAAQYEAEQAIIECAAGVDSRL